MDWVAITPSSDMDGLELGYFVGNNYRLSKDALEKLSDVNNKLRDFASSKATRQRIIFMNSMETDFAPVINYFIEENLPLYEITIKVLSELTSPLEDYIDVFINSDDSNLYQYELSQFLNDVKNRFLDPCLSQKIFSQVNESFLRGQFSQAMDKGLCEEFFRLIYNVLSIPDALYTSSEKSNSPKSISTSTNSSSQRQNQIIWNFFACKLDELLLCAIEKDMEANLWSLRILEVIAVIYRDQSVHNLKAVLRKWLDSSYSDESSEDNESNTSSPRQNLSINEDSSDYKKEISVQGGQKKLKEDNADAMSCKSSDSASKEPPSKKICGIPKRSSCNFTPQTNLSNIMNSRISAEISTGSSSNEDDKINNGASHHRHKRNPAGHHLLSSTERRDIRIKKINQILKRSRKRICSKSIVDDDEISLLLTEFTVSFIMSGYSKLIENLRLKLMSSKPISPLNNTKSRFLWLISFFLRFVLVLEVKLPIIESVFSPEILSYLVFEGVRIFEDLEMESRSNFSNHQFIKSQGRHLHLVVSAIKQIFITINAIEKEAESHEVKIKIHQIIIWLSEMSSLRQFQLLLVRKFSPTIQSRKFIDDVIITNHELLVMFEKVHFSRNFLKQHLKQFATVEVMRQYGYSLEQFRSNPDYLNEAIFTMMHHVSGDLNAPEALFLPRILKIFSDVWEKDLVVGDVWSDLIEYVIQKFINAMDEDTLNAPPLFLKNLVENDRGHVDPSCSNGRLRYVPFKYNQKIDSLQWHYSQCKKRDDPVGSIIEMYKEADNVTMTRQSVLQALLSYGVITHAQYIGLAKVKSTLEKSYAFSDATRSLIAEVGSQGAESEFEQEPHQIPEENMDFSSQPSTEKVYVDEIEALKDILISQGKEHLINWIQRELVNVILVKFHARSERSVHWSNGVLEPIAYYSLFWNENIPMVPWSLMEESGLQTDNFLMLLKKIGVNIPTEIEKYFPRIPSEWSIDHLLNISRKLGPISLTKKDFDIGNHSVFSGTNH